MLSTSKNYSQTVTFLKRCNDESKFKITTTQLNTKYIDKIYWPNNFDGHFLADVHNVNRPTSTLQYFYKPQTISYTNSAKL